MGAGAGSGDGRLSVVYMGTPEFAVPALEALLADGRVEVCAVVTAPDRVRGRGGKVRPTAVGAFAEARGLRVYKPERAAEILGHLPTADAQNDRGDLDLIVVAAYGRILPKVLLALPRLGCVNIHASLLPEYRGAAPIQRAILDGKAEAGVTLMAMDEGLDTGDMLAAARVAVGGMNAGELTERLAQMGAELLIESLGAIIDGSIGRTPQDGARASYAEKLTREDERVDLSGSAEEAVRRVRAMGPVPGAYVMGKDGRVGIVRARAAVVAGAENDSRGGGAKIGAVLGVSGDGIFVQTGDGVLVIEEVKMPGKRAMKVADYLRGNAFEEVELF